MGPCDDVSRSILSLELVRLVRFRRAEGSRDLVGLRELLAAHDDLLELYDPSLTPDDRDEVLAEVCAHEVALFGSHHTPFPGRGDGVLRERRNDRYLEFDVIGLDLELPANDVVVELGHFKGPPYARNYSTKEGFCQSLFSQNTYGYNTTYSIGLPISIRIAFIC